MSFTPKYICDHTSFEEGITLVTEDSVETGGSVTKDHEENAKKAELKRLILDYLVEEDLVSDDKLDIASS